MIDYIPEDDPAWLDALAVTATSGSIRLRLRLHIDELEVLAVALDSAMTESCITGPVHRLYIHDKEEVRGDDRLARSTLTAKVPHIAELVRQVRRSAAPARAYRRRKSK